MEIKQILGEYDCKLDAKGRMRLPSGLIAQMGEGKHKFVVNRGFEKCLILYPEALWSKISKEVDQLNLYNKKNRAFVRYFYRGATELEMDGADRILLPKRLLEYAGVGKTVVLSAYNGRVEMWNKEDYDNLLDDEPDDFSDLADDVLGGTGREEE